MSTPINSIIFPGSPEKYLLRDCRATTSESGAATSNEFGFIKVGFQGNKKNVPVSIDEDGNAYVELTDTINSLPTSDVSYLQGNNRWLIFDFQNENRRGLKVKKGTKVKLTIKNDDPEVEDEIRWLNAEEDLHYDFSDAIENFDTLYGANGTDFYVYLVPDGEEGVKLVISMDNEYPSDVESDEITYSTNNSRKIGQFHTLCVGVPAEQTAPIPETTGVIIGAQITLCNYFEKQDQEFINFYTKEITAVNDGTPYAVATIDHPLAGFLACDILPESVWCLDFHPACKNWDGMVYCKAGDFAVDIYPVSGTQSNTITAFGAVPTIFTYAYNIISSLGYIGKYPIDMKTIEFIALGSPFPDNSAGSSSAGGHSSSSGNRYISNIGCENCVGGPNEFLGDLTIIYSHGHLSTTDGRSLYGANYDAYITNGCTLNSPATNFRSMGFRGIGGGSTSTACAARGRCNIFIA